jgi:hypothetical protein
MNLPWEFALHTERFLKQRAVNIAVDGHYTLSNWYDPEGRLRTFPCRTTRVSPYRMMVDVPVVGKVGDSLTSYFRDFGKLDGRISDTKPGCFLLELDVTYAVRQKLADKLTWLEEKQKDPEIIDLRKESRIIPAHSHSTLTLADGTIHECFIIDISATGVAVSAELQPEIGTPLAVGACVGRVVRAFPSGFAVKFVERQKQHELDGLILIARPIRASCAPGAKAAPERDDAAAEPAEA